MAERFEPYHVPQQSRRDKLRVINHQPACGDNLQIFAPFYDPPLDFNLHRQNFTTDGDVKGEGVNLMGFVGGMSANHMYAAPQLSVHLNPNPIQDINATSPYVYASPLSYRGLLDQPFNGNEAAAAAVYKPAPQTVAAASGGQSLSLSLSSHCNNLPLELNLPRYDSTVFSSTKASEGYLVSGGSAPAVPGPFTGYASVLRGSRFLKPAQQLLEELCDMGRGIYAEKNGADSSLLDPSSLESLSGSEIVDGDSTKKKSRLLLMLDEVYKRNKQYYQQIESAVAAFESVAGLSNAAPFAILALKAMSKHFRCLKNAITDQLQFTSKSHHSERDETQKLESSGQGSYSQRPFHAGFVDQPVWRPQRGLPERAVTVLRSWLFEHFLHPYPTDTDKIMLAKQAGLSRNQVSNWFINARVRLWKPMVEEIHMLETRQGQQKPSQREEEQKQPPNSVNNHLPAVECENASTSIKRVGDFPMKRCREDPSTEAMTYGNMGVGLNNAGSSGGVSLTLGLHQNCVGLPDSSYSYPINAARRFGLESNGEGYVVSGFAAHNREFGRDVIDDGQIMHDFVG